MAKTKNNNLSMLELFKNDLLIKLCDVGIEESRRGEVREFAVLLKYWGLANYLRI